MTVRVNQDGQLEADFFGLKARTTRQGALRGFAVEEGDFDYPATEGEPRMWTALVFDDTETDLLRKAALAATTLAEDQDTVNLAIKLVEFLDTLENYAPPAEGKALTEDDIRNLSAAGS